MKLNFKKIIIIEAILSIVVLALFAFLVVYPRLNAITMQGYSLNKLKEEVALRERLSKNAKAVKRKEANQDHFILEEEIKYLKNDIRQLKQNMVDSQRIAEVVEEISSGDYTNGIIFHSIKPQFANITRQEDFSRLDARVELEAAYPVLMNYLKALDGLSTATGIEAITIKRDDSMYPHLRAEIDLALYFKKNAK